MTSNALFESVPDFDKAAGLRGAFSLLGRAGKTLLGGARAAPTALKAGWRAKSVLPAATASTGLSGFAANAQLAGNAALRASNPVSHAAGRLFNNAWRIGNKPITMTGAGKGVWRLGKLPLFMGAASYSGRQYGNLEGQAEGAAKTIDQMTQSPWQTLGLGAASLFGKGNDLARYGLRQKLQNPNLPITEQLAYSQILNRLAQ